MGCGVVDASHQLYEWPAFSLHFCGACGAYGTTMGNRLREPCRREPTRKAAEALKRIYNGDYPSHAGPPAAVVQASRVEAALAHIARGGLAPPQLDGTLEAAQPPQDVAEAVDVAVGLLRDSAVQAAQRPSRRAEAVDGAARDPRPRRRRQTQPPAAGDPTTQGQARRAQASGAPLRRPPEEPAPGKACVAASGFLETPRVAHSNALLADGQNEREGRGEEERRRKGSCRQKEAAPQPSPAGRPPLLPDYTSPWSGAVCFPCQRPGGGEEPILEAREASPGGRKPGPVSASSRPRGPETGVSFPAAAGAARGAAGRAAPPPPGPRPHQPPARRPAGPSPPRGVPRARDGEEQEAAQRAEVAARLLRAASMPLPPARQPASPAALACTTAAETAQSKGTGRPAARPSCGAESSRGSRSPMAQRRKCAPPSPAAQPTVVESRARESLRDLLARASRPRSEQPLASRWASPRRRGVSRP